MASHVRTAADTVQKKVPASQQKPAAPHVQLAVALPRPGVRHEPARAEAANVPRPAVQTKLNIYSLKPSFHTQVRNQLKELVGVGVLKFTTAPVVDLPLVRNLPSLTTTQVSMLIEDPEETQFPKSAALVKQVIDSPKTTTIKPATDTEALPVATWGELLNPWKTSQVEAFKRGSTPNRGADVNVYFNPSPPEKLLSTVVEREGEVKVEPTSSYMTLAHELIHASHFQAGKASYNRHATRGRELTLGSFYSIPQSPGGITSVEEIRTVGLSPIPPNGLSHPYEENYHRIITPEIDEEQITENDLREEHDMPRRIQYQFGEEIG